MYFQDIFAAANIRPIDKHLTVEASRPQQRLVERFGAVGGRHHNHARIRVEAVHLHQQCVQRLFAFVMPTDDASPACLAQRIQLVDEDDARRLGFGLLEHVANTRSPDTDEHLDKIAARQTEERHPRLARDRLGQQSLAGAWWAYQQHALGDPPAKPLVLFR